MTSSFNSSLKSPLKNSCIFSSTYFRYAKISLTVGRDKIAAMIAQSPVADRVVITVKKKTEIFVKNFVVSREFFENHFLEKPRRMRDVPARRRNVFNRLRDIILDFQRSAEFFGVSADVRIERFLNPAVRFFEFVMPA